MEDNKLYDSEFEYNGKIFKQFPSDTEAKRLDTLDCLYGLDTIYVKDLADDQNLTERSFIEETSKEYNVELISIEKDVSNHEMWTVVVKGRPVDVARYFSLGEMKSLSDYFNNYSDTLAVSECDINESYRKYEGLNNNVNNLPEVTKDIEDKKKNLEYFIKTLGFDMDEKNRYKLSNDKEFYTDDIRTKIKNELKQLGCVLIKTKRESSRYSNYRDTIYYYTYFTDTYNQDSLNKDSLIKFSICNMFRHGGTDIYLNFIERTSNTDMRTNKVEEFYDDREARTNYIKTLYDYLERNNLLDDGVDTGDEDYDMITYFGYTKEDVETDNFDKFMDLLAKNIRVTSSQENYCVVNYTEFVKNNLGYFDNTFDIEYSNEDEQIEIYVCSVIPQLVNGGFSDSLYKDFADYLTNNTKINENYTKLEEDDEIFNGDTEVNLKLTDGTIIHIACDSNGEGYYYEVYDRLGDEIDGGLMEYEDGEVDRDVTVKEVIKRIADFSAIPSLLDKDTVRISDDEYIEATTKTDNDNDTLNMAADYNYKLPDGRYLHFHTNEEGFDYTIFDENGKLLDGGILEYWTDDEDLTEKEVLTKLAEFTDISELKGNLEKINDEFWDMVEY